MSDAKFKPVILVCGKTGIGKTSLIQAVTGRETVPDSAIGTGMPVTHGFTPYETEAATFVDAEGMEPGTLSGIRHYQEFPTRPNVCRRYRAGIPDNIRVISSRTAF